MQRRRHRESGPAVPPQKWYAPAGTAVYDLVIPKNFVRLVRNSITYRLFFVEVSQE